MKKLILILAVLTSLSIMAACASKDISKEVSDSTPANSQPTDLPPTTFTADSFLDDQLLSQALSSNNLEECKSIQDGNKKIECEKIIQSVTISKDALNKRDKTLCKKIKLDRYKENCEQSIDRLAADAKKFQGQLQFYNDQLALANKYEQEDNLEGCFKIEDENFKGQCEFNTLYNRAKKFKDPSYCAKISNKSKVELCKTSLTTATEASIKN